MSQHLRQFIRQTHQKLKDFHGHVLQLREKKKNDESFPAHPLSAQEKKDKLEITVSAGTAAKFISIALLLLLVGAFLYEIRDILVIFFVALLFAAALDPMVDRLQEKKIPRAVGVILIYLFILLILALFFSNLVPVVAKEVSELAVRIQDFIVNFVSGDITLPSYLAWLKPLILRFTDGVDVSKIGDYKDVLLQVAKQLSDVAGNVFNAVLVIFNGFFNTLLILVLTFLMVIDEASIDKFILSLFPARHADYIRRKSNAVKEKMGYWLRGQVVLCIVVGVLVYIGFLVIGLFTHKVEYAATIALLAGFTELIPYAGPFLAWLIALPIVANQSIGLIVWMTALMYIVQMLENNFIVPMIMHKAVGISPIFVMFAMMVGFSFLGVLGMVLSVPVATGVAIFLKDYAEKEK